MINMYRDVYYILSIELQDMSGINISVNEIAIFTMFKNLNALDHN